MRSRLAFHLHSMHLLHNQRQTLFDVSLLLVVPRSLLSSLPLLTAASPFNLSYEIYYALSISESNILRLLSILTWFMPDLIWLLTDYHLGQINPKPWSLAILFSETLLLCAVYHLSSLYNRDVQCNAYWFGILALLATLEGAFQSLRRYPRLPSFMPIIQ